MTRTNREPAAPTNDRTLRTYTCTGIQPGGLVHFEAAPHEGPDWNCERGEFSVRVPIKRNPQRDECEPLLYRCRLTERHWHWHWPFPSRISLSSRDGTLLGVSGIGIARTRRGLAIPQVAHCGGGNSAAETGGGVHRLSTRTTGLPVQRQRKRQQRRHREAVP